MWGHRTKINGAAVGLMGSGTLEQIRNRGARMRGANTPRSLRGAFGTFERMRERCGSSGPAHTTWLPFPCRAQRACDILKVLKVYIERSIPEAILPVPTHILISKRLMNKKQPDQWTHAAGNHEMQPELQGLVFGSYGRKKQRQGQRGRRAARKASKARTLTTAGP